MGIIYTGYFDLSFIAIGGLAFLGLFRLSNSSLFNRSISIEEAKPSIYLIKDEIASEYNELYKALYEDAVLNGSFKIPRAGGASEFFRLNKLLFPSDVEASAKYYNIIAPNTALMRLCDLIFSSPRNSPLLLMNEAGHTKVLTC